MTRHAPICAGLCRVKSYPAHTGCTSLGRMNAGFFEPVQGVQTNPSRVCTHLRIAPTESHYATPYAHVIYPYTPCTEVEKRGSMRPSGVQKGSAGYAPTLHYPAQTTFRGFYGFR
jgi:hypothetical protein